MCHQPRRLFLADSVVCTLGESLHPVSSGGISFYLGCPPPSIKVMLTWLCAETPPLIHLIQLSGQRYLLVAAAADVSRSGMIFLRCCVPPLADPNDLRRHEPASLSCVSHVKPHSAASGRAQGPRVQTVLT